MDVDKRIRNLETGVANLQSALQTDVWPRITALEARCHELEHSRAKGVQGQIADLQERVTNTQELLLQTVARLDAADTAWAATRKRQMDALRKECGVEVDDQRDKERPKEPGPVIRDVRKQATPAVPESKPEAHPVPRLVRCPSYANCTNCVTHRVPHVREAQCNLPCRDGGVICQPVPAQEPEKPAPELVRCEDWQQCKLGCHALASGGHRTPHARRPDCDQMSELCRSRCIPVPTELDHQADPTCKATQQSAPVDDPRQWLCQAVVCARPGTEKCPHRTKHSRMRNCQSPCYDNHCIPVPASPEVAIPDVPVGTEAFRERLAGHMQELSGGYRWGADHLADGIPGSEYLERLAGVACTLRDAYELARTGEQEQAEEKLREIEW